MAKRAQKEPRATRRREEAATKLIALGGAFVLVPLFLGKSPLGVAFGALMPIGFLMLAAGVALMLLVRADRRAGERLPTRNVANDPPRYERGSASEQMPTDTSAACQWATNRIKSSAPAQSQRPSKWAVEVFDVIEWRRFEAVVEALFQQAGFDTTSQTHGADQGVDIWLYSRSQRGHPVSLVQCKHWQGKRVGVDQVRELRGVMAHHDVKRGQFAATSTFTPDAEDFARANGINLLDVHRLLALIGKRSSAEQEALLAVALEGDYSRPTCVNCGVKMVNRTPRSGGKDFWGCAHYPRCKTTLPIRGA